MSKDNPFKGESPLAQLADRLPVRARIGLAVVAADLAPHHLESSINLSVARTAHDLACEWFDGQRFDPDRFADATEPESGGGTFDCGLEAKGKDEEVPWILLHCAILYVVNHAYSEVGVHPTSLINEFDVTRSTRRCDRSHHLS